MTGLTRVSLLQQLPFFGGPRQPVSLARGDSQHTNGRGDEVTVPELFAASPHYCLALAPLRCHLTMASTATAPLTLGMQLDAALAQLDSLSSPQLYGLIVLVTVLIATLLLGNAQPLDEGAIKVKKPLQQQPELAVGSNGPEPRWYIFRLFNYAMLIAFGASVVEFYYHNDLYTKDRALLLRVLVGWCLCLIYFFGFFGVSIVHTEVTANVPEKSLDKTSAFKDLGCGNTNSTTTQVNKQTQINVKPKRVPLPDATDYTEWTDEQLAQLVIERKWKDHELEKKLDALRAVQVRRKVFEQKLGKKAEFDWTQELPAKPSLDYASVYGANCEIVIGYVPLPVGLVGPLPINGQDFYVPMATTEGCLVASTNRGAKAIAAGGGATAIVTRDGITRAPCVRLPSAAAAAGLKLWCEEPSNFAQLQAAFSSTTRYGKLSDCQVTVAGRNAYLRLVCASGDAMGMNMVSKGSLAVIDCLRDQFGDLELVALSGNMCTDKKAAAVNWLQGRGKSVVVEATIPADVVRTTLKTTVAAMVHTNLHKNLIGSAMAGALGGFNAHASNIVTAVFLATGQDPAQNVESSQCITLLEETAAGDLWISCTMPSIEVGTVGGGTRLAAQAACLELVGCRGGNAEEAGANARKLAAVVASATLAGELSLLAALAANTLVQAHMQHNRKK